MGLVLKYVRIGKSGSYEFRRRVPTGLVAAIGKREFKYVLGATQAEALRKYPVIADAVVRQITSAKRMSKNQDAARKGDLVS